MEFEIYDGEYLIVWSFGDSTFTRLATPDENKDISAQLKEKAEKESARLAERRAQYFENVAACLREFGRAGVTVAEATKSFNASIAALRDKL